MVIWSWESKQIIKNVNLREDGNIEINSYDIMNLEIPFTTTILETDSGYEKI